MKSYEANLPEGYREVYHLNATDKKVGLIFNGVAFAVLAAIMLICAIPLFLSGGVSFEVEFIPYIIGLLGFLAAMLIYIVLHELVHGIAYKALTHRKLTYGISWSCAFCGVPDIYVYRKTAIIALLAPFVTFTLIFVPLTAAFYFVHPLLYLASAFLLGLHVGGCSGDLYMFYLLAFRHKSKSLLVRDTGPEQFLYENN
ncbi:MAG: DUF3267 domain-containing protein [Clostridia bacterium]|nr:DUF3267 domain-containing protein [Clostridia bacterium]